MSDKLKKIPLKLITWLLVIGVFLVIGFLSFIEMLSMYNVIGFAIASFLLAGLVEGEVYQQSISRALSINKVETSIYLKEFALLKDQNKDNQFFAEYLAIEKEISDLNKMIKHSKWKKNNKVDEEVVIDVEDAKKTLIKQKYKLKWMQEYCIDVLKGTICDSNLDGCINENKIQALRHDIEQKKLLSKACFVASVVSGVGYGLVFLHAAPESIIALANYFNLGLSLTTIPLALTIGIYVFSFIAAAGFMLLIYNSLSDMVAEEALTNSFKKMFNFFSRQEKEDGRKETPFEVFLRVTPWILVGLSIIGLCVFVTVTTSGTWWNEAQAGIEFLSTYMGNAATWLCGFTVVVMAITTFNFGLYNSLRAVRGLANASINVIEKNLQKAEEKIFDCYANETRLQFLNPFRALSAAISIPFKLLVFLGHIISTGLIGEGSNLLPKEWAGWTTFINALQDGAVDGFFLFSEDDHGHSHGGIPEFFLKCVFFLSGIMIADFLWDWLSSKSLTYDKAWDRAWYGIKSKPKEVDPVSANKLLTTLAEDKTSDSLLKVVKHKINQKVPVTLNAVERQNQAANYLDKVFHNTAPLEEKINNTNVLTAKQLTS